jgi:hypothetical protein
MATANLAGIFNPTSIDIKALGQALQDLLIKQANDALNGVRDSISALPTDVVNTVLAGQVASAALVDLPDNPSDADVLLQQSLILARSQYGQLLMAATQQQHAHIANIEKAALGFLTGLGTGVIGLVLKAGLGV